MQNDALEQRVRHLERMNRIILAIAAVFASLFLMGAARDDGVIRGHAVDLTSADGAVQARLVAGEDGPGLYLYDENGVQRIALFHAADASGLFVSDASSTTRIGIAQFAHGGGGVALHGPNSRGAAVLYFEEQGSLRFFDAAGEITNRVLAIDE